jgi:hypothetical protein
MGPIAHTRGWSRSAQMGPIYSGGTGGSLVPGRRASACARLCLRALPRPFRDACSPASAIGLHHDGAADPLHCAVYVWEGNQIHTGALGLRAGIDRRAHPMKWGRRQPIWHQLATRKEISEIAELDRSIAELRRRRQALVNRAKLRTPVWIERHPEDGDRGALDQAILELPPLPP